MYTSSLLSILSLVLSVSSVPDWEDLECEDGSRYLFSEVSLSWSEARGECSLYGGWLVSLNSLQEQNCLLRHAQTRGLSEDWYWTDGQYVTCDVIKDPECRIGKVLRTGYRIVSSSLPQHHQSAATGLNLCSTNL